MVTLTLFDVAAIISLRPTSEVFEPFVDTNDIIGFNLKWDRFSNFINDHFSEATTEVSNEENVSFLYLWLTPFIFSSSSLQVGKYYVTLSNRLHAGRNVCLGQLILATLYESLNLESYAMKSFSPTKNSKGTLLLVGPFWLL